MPHFLGHISPELAVAREKHKFAPGNPGKPRGSRHQLTAHFMTTLYNDFREHGVEVIAKVRETDPSIYLRIVAALVPKEVKIERPLAEMSDDELASAVSLLRSAVAGDLAGDGIGTAATGGGKPAGAIPAVSKTAPIPRSRQH